MPAARATSDSVIDDQSRLSSNSRIPSRIESRSSTRDASAYEMRCALLEPRRSLPALRAGGTPTRGPKSRGLVTRATVSLPVTSLAQDLFPSLRSPRPPSRVRDLHHLEIGFRRAAIRAAPVVGNVVPPGARGDAILGPALGLVVLESALHADEQFEWVGLRFAQALTAGHFIAPSLFSEISSTTTFSRTAQSGQHQSSGMSLHGVPAGNPSRAAPFASS